MSLIGFHRFLILAAILFCAGYSGYELFGYSRVGDTGSLVQGIVFALLAVGLVVYLVRLNRFLGMENEEAERR